MIDDIPNIKKLRKLRVIEILTSRSIDPMDMAATLKVDGVISAKDVANIAVARDKPEELLKLMEAAKNSGVVDLLDYEWQLLPSQRVSVTMVTPSGIREFKYEEP